METRNLSPIGWAVRPFKRYAEFSGRSSRAEFWWFTLFVMMAYLLIVFGFGMFAGVSAKLSPTGMGSFGASAIMFAFVGLFWLALIVPSIAVQMRRLHDINRSGWWLGAFWLLYLVYLGVTLRSLIQPGTAAGIGSVAAMGVVALAFFVYSLVLLVFFCQQGTKGPTASATIPMGPTWKKSLPEQAGCALRAGL
jgi:uncharacterized membrane protein YhaH (DUF805 family)